MNQVGLLGLFVGLLANACLGSQLDEFQSNGLALAGDAASIDQKIMDTDIQRSGMNEMNKFLSEGMMKCKDKFSTKKCKKLKKAGKCKDKKTWKKCMLTCKKCNTVQCIPAITCSGHGICANDGSCICDVGFYGDSCDFPEICDDEPGFLRNGDKIHLLNQYGTKSYLDTCALSTCPSGGVYDLQTSTSPNRDSGSGTWEIRSAIGFGPFPIRYGDKIHLLNQYGTKSYLDTCGIETLEGCNGQYNLQTSISPDRDNGSGTWEISSEKCIGGPVRNGDKIHLINQYETKSYLDTCSEVSIEECDGTYHLQTSTNPNRDSGSGTWKIKIVYQDNENFALFDNDDDGVISLSEWIEKCAIAMNYTMISSMVGREMNKTTYNEIFNETDCDDDGNISPKELKMATEQLWDGCCGIPPCCPWCGIVIKTIVSALQGPTSPLPCPTQNIEIKGNDFQKYQNITSWENCGFKCSQTDSCTNWSWIAKGLVCDLKYAMGELTEAIGVISGSKYCFASPG